MYVRVVCYNGFASLMPKIQAGASFFSGWDFWNTTDPSGGVVDYLDQGDAVSLQILILPKLRSDQSYSKQMD